MFEFVGVDRVELEDAVDYAEMVLPRRKALDMNGGPPNPFPFCTTKGGVLRAAHAHPGQSTGDVQRSWVEVELTVPRGGPTRLSLDTTGSHLGPSVIISEMGQEQLQTTWDIVPGADHVAPSSSLWH